MVENLSAGTRQRTGHRFLRYAKDNPLAMIASALIISMLVARFAFLGGPAEDAPFNDE